MSSEIVERDGTVGGRMGTVKLGGRSLDCGGKNIGKRYRLFRRFAASLGDHPFEHFGLNSSQVLNGKIQTFDSNARWRTLIEMMRSVSPADLARFANLLCRVKSNETAGYLGSSYSQTVAKRCDHLPVSRYFSPEFCRRIIRPMTVRMNGAEPDEVYMGNLASNVRMLLDTYEQFKEGLAPLLNSFTTQYKVHLNTATEALVVNDGRVTGVRIKNAAGDTTELHGAGVILATPASTAAGLTATVQPELARQLRSVSYHPVTLILAEYDKPVFSPNVRALLFDATEACSNAGAYGINDLNLVRYTFSGRTARQYMSNGIDSEELLRIGEASLSRYIPFDSQSLRRFVAKRFNQGLCAYTPYHGRFITTIQHELEKVPGLHIAGDYIQGASIEACFRSASECVNRIVQQERRAVSIDAEPLEQTTQRDRSNATPFCATQI
jgi:oxygen-dependent protoporphyrinogen oxidase